MKKITIATLAALMLGTVQADYTIKQPLEQNQGGSLPNGSINFTQGIQEPPSTKECRPYSSQNSWIEMTYHSNGFNRTNLKWDNSLIGSIGNTSTSEFLSGGFLYTAGVYDSAGDNMSVPYTYYGRYFGICRDLTR